MNYLNCNEKINSTYLKAAYKSINNDDLIGGNMTQLEKN